MADPFEVRMRFTSQLQHMNASVTSAQKAASYALKHRKMDEDLHSCILEQLERNNMNNRANIMFFLEHLCEMSQREQHMEFIRMIQRDILRIVDGVAPADGTGATNVKVVRRVLKGLEQRGILDSTIVLELEEALKERDVASSVHTALDDQPAQRPSEELHTPRAAKSNGMSRFDKKQIEQRIEEDRERHKRLRESIWAIHDAEEETMWDECSDVGDDEDLGAEEEAAERQESIEFS